MKGRKSGMTINDYHYMCALADSLSFRIASENCYIEQPTLTISIKKSEKFFGFDIFERTKGQSRVSVSAEGKKAINIARQICSLDAEFRDIKSKTEVTK